VKTDVSEECHASTFKVEEKAMQETRIKQASSGELGH
jgi:hypothetical protein